MMSYQAGQKVLKEIEKENKRVKELTDEAKIKDEKLVKDFQDYKQSNLMIVMIS